MTCKEFQNRLERATEELSPLSDDITVHFAECDSDACQTAWQEYQLLAQAIPEWKHAVPTVDLTEQILAALQTKPAPVEVSLTRNPATRRQAENRSLPAVVASVAVVCAIVALAIHNSPVDQEGRPVATAHGPSISPETANAFPAHLTEAEPLEELGIAYANLMQGATARVSDTVSFVLADEDSAAPPADDTPGWMGTFGEQLRPFEEKLNRTFRSLIDDTEMDAGQTG